MQHDASSSPSPCHQTIRVLFLMTSDCCHEGWLVELFIVAVCSTQDALLTRNLYVTTKLKNWASDYGRGKAVIYESAAYYNKKKHSHETITTTTAETTTAATTTTTSTSQRIVDASCLLIQNITVFGCVATPRTTLVQRRHHEA